MGKHNFTMGNIIPEHHRLDLNFKKVSDAEDAKLPKRDTFNLD